MKKEEINIKIGSKDMVLWRDLIDQTERQIEQLDKGLVVNKAILSMAKEKYKECEIEWNKKDKKSETTQST